VINGVDVMDVTHNFMQQEWSCLHSHYDYIHQEQERIVARGQGGPQLLPIVNAWGCSQAMDDILAHSIQALEQAGSILSEITVSIQPRNDVNQGSEEANNAGNGFGVASYDDLQIREEEVHKPYP